MTNSGFSSAAAFSVPWGDGVISTGLPVLEGERRERLLADVEPVTGGQVFQLGRLRGLLAGVAVLPAFPDVEPAGLRAYEAMLAETTGWHLVRIWNYVPRINEPGPETLENYRRFCRGRSRAIETVFGPEYRKRLSSASAVGTDADALVVYFLASRERPAHFENPEQVPAYDYPPEHGPRSPSFSRATVTPWADGRLACISGTASIKGHVTHGENDLDAQIDCTLDNLAIMGRQSGLGEDLAAGTARRRMFKVYVRHAADLPRIRARLQTTLLQAGDCVSYLRSDICRAALLLEIEATLELPPGAGSR